ncbi:MAG TPA: insulinase family protein [Clostridia bacterium]|nr:insulinase family protein [Clostridia bacterium]
MSDLSQNSSRINVSSNSSTSGTDFHAHELAKGVRLFINQTDKFKTNTAFVFIHQNLTQDLATKTALLPMVLKRGTEKYPSTALLARHLDWLYGAEIQTSVLKMGERHIISIRLEMPNAKYLPGQGRKDARGTEAHLDLLEEGFRTLGQVVFKPVREGKGLKPSYVAQEKENLRRFIESIINEKSEYASMRLFEEMCKGERYGTSRLGRIEDIESIDPFSLALYHEELLARNPIDIFFVGNVDTDALIQIAGSTFLEQGSRSGEIAYIPPADVNITPNTVKTIKERQDVNQAKLVMGFRTRTSKADDDFWALQFYNGVLGMFPHSRLFRNVREKHSLAYYVYSRVEATKGLLMVGSGIDAKAFDQVIEITRRDMEEIAEGKITDEEMDFTLKALINRVKSREDVPSSKVLDTLESEINGVAINGQEEIKRLSSITKEDVSRMARKVLLDTIYFLSREEDENGTRSGQGDMNISSKPVFMIRPKFFLSKERQEEEEEREEEREKEEVSRSEVDRSWVSVLAAEREAGYSSGAGSSDGKSSGKKGESHTSNDDEGVLEAPELSETLYWRILPGSLKAYVLPKPGYLKKHATFATNYGSIDSKFVIPETGELVEVPAGVAHFLEHKVFEEEDGNAFDKFAAWGASSNAYTTHSYTTYLFSTTENFELCLKYLLRFVQSLYLTDQNVQKEKGIIEQEVRMYEDMPEFKVLANLMRALFHEHPVRIEIGGTVESVRSINREILEKCYRTFYHPSNMVAFVVGDVNPEAVFDIMAKEMQRIIEGKRGAVIVPWNGKKAEDTVIRRLYPEEPMLPKEKRVTHNMVVARPIVNIGFKDRRTSETGWDALMKEIATAFALEIVLGKGSDLYQSLYEEGLINEKFSMGYSSGKGYGLTVLHAETPDPERLEKVILEGLRRYQDKGLEEEDFIREQRKAIGQFLGVFNQPEEVAQYFNEYYFRGIHLFDYLEALTKITFEEVSARLEEHFDPQQCAVSMVLPKS